MSTLDVKYVPDSCSFGLEIFKENPDLGVWLYKYDQNGNLIFQSGGGGNLVTGDGYYREYDDFGQLVRVRNGSSVSSALLEEYVYDHSGQRIKIKRNDSANTTVYTPFKELMRVVNSTGSYDFTYVYEGNTLVARINPDGSKQYEHTDHLGSTSVITNQNGNVVENTSYTPYGEVVLGGDKEVRGYTGQFDDELTNQMYYGARYYDPSMGLFVQGDPEIQNIYDPQFLNHYTYVRNNPYVLVDPDGKNARVYLNREAAIIFKEGSLAGPWGHYAVAIDDPANIGQEILFENSGVDSIFENAKRSHFSKDINDKAGHISLPETYDDFVKLEHDETVDKKMIEEALKLEKGRWTYVPQYHDSESYALRILESGGYKVDRNYWSPTKTFDLEIKKLKERDVPSARDSQARALERFWQRKKTEKEVKK